LGTLFSAPLRALANGIPGSDIHMVVLSPSLTYEHSLFDVKLAAQFYDVDIDLSNNEDQGLTGYNLRATAQLKLLDEMIRVFGSFALRSNQQVAVPNVTERLDDDFSGRVIAGGLEFNYGDLSIGGQAYVIRTEATPDNALTTYYVNAGAMYWLWERTVSAGFRFAYSDVDAEAENAPALLTTVTLIGALRLTI